VFRLMDVSWCTGETSLTIFASVKTNSYQNGAAINFKVAVFVVQDILGVVAHWLDEEWKRRKVSLGTVKVKSTIGTALAIDIVKVLKQWGVHGRVSAFVVDGGGNLKAAVDAMERTDKLRVGLEEAAHAMTYNTFQPVYKASCWAHLMSLSIR